MLYGLGVMTPLWAKAPAAGVNYTDREDIIAFLKEVSAQKGIPYDWLETEIALARYSPLAERYMTPKPQTGPATTPDRNFRLYQRNMVNSERFSKGVDFLEQHVELFSHIENLSLCDCRHHWGGNHLWEKYGTLSRLRRARDARF